MKVASFALSRSLLLPLAVAAASLRCGTGGTEPNLVDITGHWEFVEQFTDPAYRVTCADTGGYDIVQTANGFVGAYGQRGYCSGPGIGADNTDSGFVTEGHVVGRTIRFKAPNCDYDGRVHDGNDDHVSGHVACSIGDATITYNFTGTWSATR
jgi:hypothetical protein